MCSVVYTYTTRLLCESYASPCVTLMLWVNHDVCVTWNRALFYVAVSRSNVKGCMDGIAKCSLRSNKMPSNRAGLAAQEEQWDWYPWKTQLETSLLCPVWEDIVLLFRE